MAGLRSSADGAEDALVVDIGTVWLGIEQARNPAVIRSCQGNLIRGGLSSLPNAQLLFQNLDVALRHSHRFSELLGEQIGEKGPLDPVIRVDSRSVRVSVCIVAIINETEAVSGAERIP